MISLNEGLDIGLDSGSPVDFSLRAAVRLQRQDRQGDRSS
jgi:hypothetical protein